jgi:hypothetical protein
MESASTYRAVQAAAPGRLKLVRTPIRDPGPDEVRIRVEACGVCHSHAATVDGVFPIDWPRVPGREAVGRIDVLSAHVQIWVPRQRVGVGFPGGFCGYCRYCRGGGPPKLPQSGIHRHPSRRWIRRNTDRQGERPDVHSGRPFVRRCGVADSGAITARDHIHDWLRYREEAGHRPLPRNRRVRSNNSTRR